MPECPKLDSCLIPLGVRPSERVRDGSGQRDQPLLWPTVVSVFGHGSVLIFGLASSLLMSHCGPKKPIIDPDKSIQVSMVVLPKSKHRMPDRAARAKVPKGQAKKPNPQPRPIRESDLTVHKPEVAPKAGNPNRSADRDAALKDLMRENLLENLLAPDGPRDRDATGSRLGCNRSHQRPRSRCALRPRVRKVHWKGPSPVHEKL